MAETWKPAVKVLGGGQGWAVVRSVHGVAHDDGEYYELPLLASCGAVKTLEGKYLFVDMVTCEKD